MNTSADTVWDSVLTSVSDAWATNRRKALLRRMLFMAWAASLVLGIAALYIMIGAQRREALRAIEGQELESKRSVALLAEQDSLIAELLRERELRWNSALGAKADSLEMREALVAMTTRQEFTESIATLATKEEVTDFGTRVLPEQIRAAFTHIDTTSEGLRQTLAGKADASYVDNQLREKADRDSVEAGLRQRVTREAFTDSIIAIRSDLRTRVTERDLRERLSGFVSDDDLRREVQRITGDSASIRARQPQQ